MQKFKIRSGDEVIVISGAEKGKFGKVIKVLTSQARVVVSGVNLASKHKKASGVAEGGVVFIEAPIHISNVALRDSDTGQPTRIRMFVEGDSKVRVGKKSGKQIKFVRS